MTRFTVKRRSLNPYGSAPILGIWVRVDELTTARTFATRLEAEAAIGRYAASLSPGYDSMTIGAAIDGMRVVELVAEMEPVPAPTGRWVEESRGA